MKIALLLAVFIRLVTICASLPQLIELSVWNPTTACLGGQCYAKCGGGGGFSSLCLIDKIGCHSNADCAAYHICNLCSDENYRRVK